MQLDFAGLMTRLQNDRPLVHCLTNNITINDSANVLLSIGARPIMAEHPKEVAYVTGIADSLLINIGNITDSRIESIFIAGRTARDRGIPIVFDPVGVSCSPLREQLTEDILSRLKPTVLKGNMSEIKKIAKIKNDSRGVDVGAADLTTAQTLRDNIEIVRSLAQKLDCTVVATGAVDIIATADCLYTPANGSDYLAQLTGTGCMVGAILAAYCTVTDSVRAALLSLSRFNVAGEDAERYILSNGSGLGTFKVKLFDGISTIDAYSLAQRSKISCTHCI